MTTRPTKTEKPQTKTERLFSALQSFATTVDDFRLRHEERITGFMRLQESASELADALDELRKARGPYMRVLRGFALAQNVLNTAIYAPAWINKIVTNKDHEEPEHRLNSSWVDSQGRKYDPDVSCLDAMNLAGVPDPRVVQTWVLRFLGISKATVWRPAEATIPDVILARPRPRDYYKGPNRRGHDHDRDEDFGQSANDHAFQRYVGLLVAEFPIQDGGIPAKVYAFWKNHTSMLPPIFSDNDLNWISDPNFFASDVDQVRIRAEFVRRFWGDAGGAAIETGHLRMYRMDMESVRPTTALAQLREEIEIFEREKAADVAAYQAREEQLQHVLGVNGGATTATTIIGDTQAARTVLLNGLPGAGKSYAARVVAAERGWRVISYEASAFLQAVESTAPSPKEPGKVGDSDPSKLLVQMSPTDLVTLVRPDMLIVDDIERIDNTMVLLDVLQAVQRSGVRWIVLTTNAVADLDPAVVRPGRVDSVIDVHGFSIDDVRAIISRNMDGHALTDTALTYAEKMLSWPYVFLAEFARMTRGYNDAERAYGALAGRVVAAQATYKDRGFSNAVAKPRSSKPKIAKAPRKGKGEGIKLRAGGVTRETAGEYKSYFDVTMTGDPKDPTAPMNQVELAELAEAMNPRSRPEPVRLLSKLEMERAVARTQRAARKRRADKNDGE